MDKGTYKQLVETTPERLKKQAQQLTASPNFKAQVKGKIEKSGSVPAFPIRKTKEKIG